MSGGYGSGKKGAGGKGSSKGKKGKQNEASEELIEPSQPVCLDRVRWAKVSFCPDPKSDPESGGFTPIYDKSAKDKKMCGSVNAGSGRNLKVGGGTINGQFEKELWEIAWHETDRYSGFHEAFLKKVGGDKEPQGLVQATADVLQKRPQGVQQAFMYLGETASEAQEVLNDSGRSAIVILDIFETDYRPYHAQNVAMVYTVGPDRKEVDSDNTFLRKVRMVGRNVSSACRAYNLKHAENGPLLERVRCCLVSGGKYAGSVSKENVARHLVFGILDGCPPSLASGEPDAAELRATPEIEFAFDGNVFSRVWKSLCEEEHAKGT